MRARRADPAAAGYGAPAAVLAYAAVGLAIDGRVPSGTLGYGLGLGGLFLVAHLAVRATAPHADPLILPSVALLNGLGLVIIRRLDFTQQPRIDATYDEHAKILQAVRAHCGDQAAMLLRAHIATSQAEVRKITLHQMHMARRGGQGA